MFGLFCIMMFIQHFYLIITGKSTLEAYEASDQREREARQLNVLYGFWAHYKDKKQVHRRWKEEYGGTGAADRWRVGTRMDMWKREMGSRWYEWICEFPQSGHQESGETKGRSTV